MAILTKTIIPDPKDLYPRSVAEAKTLIKRVFAEQGWQEDLQQIYFQLLGIKNTVKTLTHSECRQVINDMQVSKMILFTISKN
jgi:hypothetical protein